MLLGHCQGLLSNILYIDTFPFLFQFLTCTFSPNYPEGNVRVRTDQSNQLSSGMTKLSRAVFHIFSWEKIEINHSQEWKMSRYWNDKTEVWLSAKSNNPICYVPSASTSVIHLAQSQQSNGTHCILYKLVQYLWRL